MKVNWFKHSLAVAALGAFSSMASSAILVGTFPGNDCPGTYGANFPSCVIPADIGVPNTPSTPATPVIIKFDFDNDVIEINSALFPTIDGSEFDLDLIGDGGTGTWTYTPGDGDPVINFFAAKGGNNFNLFFNNGDPLSDTWFTPTNPNNNQLFGLSHLTFYDTTGPIIIPVPEPAALTLLGLGLAGLAFVRRRKR